MSKNNTPTDPQPQASSLQSSNRQVDYLHVPVLLNEVMTLLNPKEGESYLDLTAGYAGHATKVIQKIGDQGLATLVDRDVFAFEYLNNLPEVKRANIVQSSYEYFVSESTQTFDMILLDLGVSSPQLDVASRGFSFSKNADLDMRMDQSQDLSALNVVNDYSEAELINILKEYGEVHAASVIAQAIVQARPLKTTNDLMGVLNQHKGLRQKNIPTLVFQAIRIEVNDEIGQLERSLPNLLKRLNPGGRLAIISFHSLEDRIVKKFFRSVTENKYESNLQLLTKKAISGAKYDVTNPRSRSSQLRAVAKIKNSSF